MCLYHHVFSLIRLVPSFTLLLEVFEMKAVFQETVAPAEEKPIAPETSAPVKKSDEGVAPTLAPSGVTLSVSKGDNYFFQLRIYEVKPLAIFCKKNYLKTTSAQCVTF